MGSNNQIEMNLAEIADLIDQLMGEDDCRYDCLGYCQAHLWFDKDEICPHKRAKEMLEAIGSNRFTLLI